MPLFHYISEFYHYHQNHGFHNPLKNHDLMVSKPGRAPRGGRRENPPIKLVSNEHQETRNKQTNKQRTKQTKATRNATNKKAKLSFAFFQKAKRV